MAQSSPSHAIETVDGVERSPRTGIKVVISGAGIGGMFAALECWRKGNDVEIVEQNAALSTIGDFFAIGPSALSTLHYFPRMLSEYNATTWNSPLWWCDPSGKKLISELPEWNRPGAAPHAAKDVPVVGFIKLRPQIMQMMEDQIKRLGITIFYGRKVVGYEEDVPSGKARVRTASNEVFTGDVVVAAEGIGTRSHEIVTGGPVPFVPSGYAIIRGAFSPTLIAPNSKGAELLLHPGQTPEVRTYFGEDMHLITLFTHEKVGLAFTHKEDGSAKESWSQTIPADELIAMFKDRTNWGEQIIDFVNQVPPDTLIDWKLTWRDPQPVWASKGGCIIQLGDAAHAFLPSSANGATQAMEDGISLAECLHQGGKERVSWATKVHTKLRYQRVSVIQQVGIVARYSLHHIDMSLLNEGKNPFEDAFHLGRWIWQHKPEDYARQQFAAALDHLQTGAPFENTNLPEGHVYEDWHAKSELEKQAAGMPSQLMSNGDWSR
ncbi:Uu.00g117310.m01.CDS01 [Anthostomella pinea]|uniref:Uu.00g117310.m01.CDS01 n=1 Tax=Anthostomella pinea TaxID=933095 RepID=A0AAI8YH22_9PEZI|nr:Uu.00g117310.m01.CDS01 [Anthostomella pinea]